MHGFDDLFVTLAVTGGHFQIHAGTDTLHAVVGCSPVADDDTFEPPLITQDLGQKIVVVRGEHAVDTVVGTHNLRRLSFLDSIFKGRQIQFAEGTLVHHLADRHTQIFLAINGVVLEGSTDTFGLHTVDERCRQVACKVGILTIILKVATALGRTLDIGAGAKNRDDLLVASLVCHSSTHLVDQIRVPRRCTGNSRWEASSRYRSFHTKTCIGVVLFAHAVRTVCHHDGGYAQPFDWLGVPKIKAGTKRGLFF